MTVHAKAFQRGQGEAVYGNLSFEMGSAIFTSEDLSIRIDLRACDFSLDRGTNHFVFRSRSDGTTLLTESKSILKDPELLLIPAITASVMSYRMNRACRAAKILSIPAVLLLLFSYSVAILFQGTEALLPYILDRFPDEAEAYVGDQIMRRLEPQIIRDARLDTEIAPILNRLIDANGLNSAMRFHIVRDSEINAYAIPGRRIILNTGLLALCDSPDQIGGILAHEAAHIEKKHILRQMLSSVGVLVAASILFSGDLSELLIDNASALMRMKYSRDLEREADRHAVQYLNGASIPLTGFYSIMKKIDESSQQGEAPVILSTHPGTDERLREIAKVMKRDPKGEPVAERSFQIFKNKIKEYNIK